MAQEDLDNMVVVKTGPAATAEDQLVGYGEQLNDQENKAAAEAAGVKDAAFINYSEALDAYSAREDIESLAHKNARNAPDDFADASFMRTSDGQDGSGSSL